MKVRDVPPGALGFNRVDETELAGDFIPYFGMIVESFIRVRPQ